MVEILPEHLNYANAQILLIGEDMEGDMGKALEPTLKYQKNKKETPTELMEKLEHEDELRVHLHGLCYHEIVRSIDGTDHP